MGGVGERWQGRVGRDREVGVEVMRVEQKAGKWQRLAMHGQEAPTLSGFHSKADEEFILRKMENCLGTQRGGLKQGGFWWNRNRLAPVKSPIEGQE